MSDDRNYEGSRSNSDLDQDESRVEEVVFAALRRVMSIRSTLTADRKPKSWKISVEFDENLDLLSYREGGVDQAGTTQFGQGITRANFHLSNVQKDVLLSGTEHKLNCSSLGWSYDSGKNERTAGGVCSPATIKSLLQQGLLVSNLDDSRGVGNPGEHAWLFGLDGANHSHLKENSKIEVWTSELGKELLKGLGLLPKERHETTEVSASRRVGT